MSVGSTPTSSNASIASDLVAHIARLHREIAGHTSTYHWHLNHVAISRLALSQSTVGPPDSNTFAHHQQIIRFHMASMNIEMGQIEAKELMLEELIDALEQLRVEM